MNKKSRLWKIVLTFCLVFVASSVWATPGQWGVFVPTGAKYHGSRVGGAIGKDWGCSDCNGYDLTGIDHYKWYCCGGACIYCPGYLCSDNVVFDMYQEIGDYYDCNGSLVEKGGSRGFIWFIIRGTGTIFSGGIGGMDNNGYLIDCVTTWCSAARDCRIHVNMEPQLGYCPGGVYPDIIQPHQDRNLGRPKACNVERGNPINVATGNKFEETLDVTLSTPGIPLEFRRFYNSQSNYDGPLGYGWTHNYNLRIEEVEKDGGPGEVILWDGEGKALHFDEGREEEGSIRFIGDSGYRLTKNILTEEYRLHRDDLVHLFDRNGVLVAISDAHGNKLSLSYKGGLLTRVSNNYGKTLSFNYEKGRMTWVRDPKGQYVYYKYQNGNLTKISYPDTSSLGYAYDDDHNMKEKYDTQRRLIGHWEYHPDDRVKTYYSHLTKDEDTDEDIPQNRIDLTYSFLKTQVNNSRGTTTYKIKVINGVRVVEEMSGCPTCGGSTYKRFAYNKQGDLIAVTHLVEGKEVTTAYTYDDPDVSWDHLGLVVEKKEAAGLPEFERAATYDFAMEPGSPTSIAEIVETKKSVLAEGQTTSTTHTYSGGNLTSRTQSGYTLVDGLPELKTYRTTLRYRAGQLWQIDGPRDGRPQDTTTFVYFENTPSQANNRGQLKAIVNVLGHRIEFSDYDANGNVRSIRDPNGVLYELTYTRRNRLKTIRNVTANALTRYFYDNGRLSKVIFPELNWLEFTYEPAGHLELIEDTLGNTIHYEYDREGNRSREERKDPNGVLKKYMDLVYDPYNRLWKLINPDDTFVELIHNEVGKVKTKVDARGNTTEYTYDPLKRLAETKQLMKPEDVLTTFRYDVQDNLTAVTDANSNSTGTLFDDFGRLVQTISPDAGTTTFLYDEAGNLIQKTDPRGTVSYTYDILDRPVSVTFPDHSQDIEYTYDGPSVPYGIGRLTGMTDPSGSCVFHYDARGNIAMEKKKVMGVTYTTRYGYNKNSSLVSLTYPSGRTIIYTPNAIGKVAGVTIDGGQTLASSIAYLPFGGMTHLTYGNGLSLTHGHDLQYRIDSVVIDPILNQTYKRDPNGNITSIQHEPWNPPEEKPALYTYEPGSNRLDEVVGAETLSFGYDLSGNTTSINNRTFVYDSLNQPIAILENDVTIAEYAYNGMGERIIKVTSEGIRVFHYDTSGHLIAETDQTGKTLAEYVYLGDQPLAMIKGNLIYYFHNDHLGTPQVLTDGSGGIVWRANYTAFGEANVLIEQVENPLRFPGQYYDKETGLHYNYFRYYKPENGRYFTPDPIGLVGGINPYVYVENNPLNRTDLFGLQGSVYPGVKVPDLGDFLSVAKDFMVFGNAFHLAHEAMASLDEIADRVPCGEVAQTHVCFHPDPFPHDLSVGEGPVIFSPEISRCVSFYVTGRKGCVRRYEDLNWDLNSYYRKAK